MGYMSEWAGAQPAYPPPPPPPLPNLHNLLMQFFSLGNSETEVFETYFFDIVITQNDLPRYVKHVLGCIYVFFTLFGVWAGGGGGSQGIDTQLAYAILHPGQPKNRSFRDLFF